MISKAMMFAFEKHRGQLCDEGKPYILHPFKVADIVRLVTDDKEIIAAAYLHDTIEDTATTYDELVEEFSKRVADLVMEVSHEGQKDEVGYYFPRLKTQGGIMLKFADRLSNLSRMSAWDDGRKEHYLRRSRFWKRKPGDRWEKK